MPRFSTPHTFPLPPESILSTPSIHLLEDDTPPSFVIDCERRKGINVTDLILCQIRVKGHLSSQWADWFDGLAIENQPNGEALLSGLLPDQSALYGVLNRIRDLGLTLVAMNCVEPDSGDTLARLPDER